MTVDDYIARRTRSNVPKPANFQSLLSGPRGLLGVARPRLAEMGPPREETAGHQRYMRPEFQGVGFNRATQADLGTEEEETLAEAAPKAAPAADPRLQWPRAMPDQAAALLCLLAEQPGASAPNIAGMFNGVKLPKIEGWLETLQAMGQ